MATPPSSIVSASSDSDPIPDLVPVSDPDPVSALAHVPVSAPAPAPSSSVDASNNNKACFMTASRPRTKGYSKSIFQAITTSTEIVTEAGDRNVELLTSLLCKKTTPNVPQAIASIYEYLNTNGGVENEEGKELDDLATRLKTNLLWDQIARLLRLEHVEELEKDESTNMLDSYRTMFQNESSMKFPHLMLWLTYFAKMQDPHNESSTRFVGFFFPDDEEEEIRVVKKEKRIGKYANNKLKESLILSALASSYSSSSTAETSSSSTTDNLEYFFHIMIWNNHCSVLKTTYGPNYGTSRMIYTDPQHAEKYRQRKVQNILKRELAMLPVKYKRTDSQRKDPILIETPPEMMTLPNNNNITTTEEDGGNGDYWSSGIRCLTWLLLRSGYTPKEPMAPQMKILQRFCKKWAVESNASPSEHYYFMQAFYLMFLYEYNPR